MSKSSAVFKNTGPSQPVESRGTAFVSIIIGAVSAALAWPLWILGVGIVGGTVALILAAVARRRGQSKRMALVGFIVGSLAILVGTIALLHFSAIIGSALNDQDFQQRLRDLEE